MLRKENKSKAFPVVAIGASAGGLKAFEDLLNALPPKPGMAFVLVPHLAPQYESHLTEILARSTRLPVSEVKGGDRVSPNRIYIIPPNRAMLIKDGVLHVSSTGRKSDWRNPIDSFFRSLANDRGKMAIGILLSGEGSDGTDGLQAIKENGGTTFAQDGGTAAHLSMPHSAVVSGYVDFILSPAEIGNRLGAVRNRAAIAQDGEGIKCKPKGEESLNKILELLRTAKGVEFELYKRNTLHRRIQRRMTVRQVHDPERYLRALKADSQELELLYRDVLISVTSFFREPESFQALKNAIYPRILKNRSSHAPIRIWVPACSTGEEVYSHAINLFEFLGKRASSIPFHIFATDVNPAVIEKARAGLYSMKIKAEISPERLRRFFVQTENGYRIAPPIRERCIFAVKNLVQDPPFTNLDLISCRNLLIYLGPTLQEKALQILRYALKPRGILMLGHAETIGDFSGRFSPLNLKRKVFYERTSASSARLNFVQSDLCLGTESAFKAPEHGGQGQGKTAPDAFDLQGDLDSILPGRYIPNGVIINGELEILRFLGNTSSYLRPAPGKPSMNLRHMASGELLLELRAAIHVSKKSGYAVRKEIAATQSSGAPKRVRIEILPIKTSNLHTGYFLVIFDEIATGEPDKRRAGETRRGKESRRVIELKEDLAVSGEYLKDIIEEQESTNARLNASNENLLSSNEELQSINEELKTAKEDLQSTNMELIRSTAEIERNNQILKRANNDLSNLLANSDIPIVLLGPDLTVRRFTPSAEKALGLSSQNIGRCIVDIELPLRLSNLKQLLLNVIKTSLVQEREVEDTHGRWYYLLLRPYRTDKSKTERSRTDGAVMALIDITERKLSEKAALRLATLLRDSNDAVIIRDLDDRIIAWNKGARKMYGYTETEALGMRINRLIPGSRRMLTREWLRASARGKEMEPVEIQRRTKDGRTLDVLLTVTVLHDEKGRPVELATTEHDITKRKRAEKELKLLLARVISAQETEHKRIARDLHDGVGQALAGVKCGLKSSVEKAGLSGVAAAKILKVDKFLDRAISAIRRVSQNLMPSELDGLGLEPALFKLCREFKKRAKVHMTLRAKRVPTAIAPDLALALFRIAQEALNNIAKHSKATTVAVALSRKGRGIVLSVSDNGVGFALGGQRPLPRRGIGLENMRARAESVGGLLEVHSTHGAGTRISVHAPLSGMGENTELVE